MSKIKSIDAKAPNTPKPIPSVSSASVPARGGIAQRLKIDLEYCYGIRRLQTEFDFSNTKLYVIYAPNGAMKTSLAKTFQDLSQNQPSQDRIFKNRVSKRVIQTGDGAELQKDQVFVIEPYNESFKSGKISTLLVNKPLKEAYDAIYEDIDEKKDILLKELKSFSGLPKNKVEEILASDIAHDPKEFFVSLTRLEKEIDEDTSAQLSEISYQSIFNEKVLELLSSPDFKEKLAAYIQTYDQLIGSSTFFRKGVFNHNNAADVAKNLKDNGFFKANHTVYITAEHVKKEIANETELEKVIQEEKEHILKNAALVKSFEEIDKKVAKNKDLKDFRDYLEVNKAIIPELENLPRLRQKLWVAYLRKSLPFYKQLMEAFSKGKQTIADIIKKAKEERTKWSNVIDIFNDRFSVPFRVSIGNQDDVILKSEAPSIRFEFKDLEGSSDVEMREDELWRVLSNGERRALYLLNIIFEVEARKEAEQETLFVVDDIADSFDYKNKYAIIEYLNDISKGDKFYQIILTHNFDFYRTICSRLDLERPSKLHTSKSTAEVKIIEEKYQKNPFKHWKDNLDNDEMLIASIPFMRNLAEFCGMDDHFVKLTSLLHIKADTDTITVGSLEAIIKQILKNKNGLTLQGHDRSIKLLIYQLATTINSETAEIIDLEKKIVLSIAIRLKMEEFLIREIADETFVASISRNQTIKLIEKYTSLPSAKVESIKLAEQVNLMTPENIHINSFMYEPILDMSNEHLKALFGKVSSLHGNDVQE